MVKTLALFFGLGLTAFAQAPALYYSDLINGMCSGGQNNLGHIITINGTGFGSAQDSSHYVTLTSSGAGQNAAAYLSWSNNQISFQPGCSFASGTNATITVTTPGGTSNGLPFQIYTGAKIYFADQGSVTGITGSDTNNGTSTSTPFLTLSKCLTSAAAAPGGACYLMPGFVQNKLWPGCSGYVCFAGMAGTANQYISLIGYPTSPTNEPQIGNGVQDPVLRLTSTKYVVVSNLKAISLGTYEAVRVGYQVNQGIHHARVINIDQTLTTTAAIGALQVVYASFVQIYGLHSHDMNDSSSGKHVVHVYVGDSSHDIDIGWATLDGSCSFNSSPCHDGKQLEVHVTTMGDYIPAPPQPALTAAPGGSLAAGTYDVVLTYGSQAYSFSTTSYGPTETLASTAQTTTLNGLTGTAITIADPPGYQRPPTRDDGATVICNPTLSYRVYACLRSSPGTPCTAAQFQYQGSSDYSNTTVYDGISGAPYTLSSLASGEAPPSTATANVSGCNIYDLGVHDSQFLDSPDYASPLGLNLDAKAPHYVRYYNNTFMNSGNGANPPGDSEYPNGDTTTFAPICLSPSSPDPSVLEAPGGGLIDIYNNTFFNCGSLSTYWTLEQGAVGISGAPGYATAYAPLTINMQDNIIYQPQAGQAVERSDYLVSFSNLTATGSNNLCYAPLTGSPNNVCPAAWGTRISADPLFVSTGAKQTGGANGGPYWSGLDLSLQPGSPAIGAGVDRGYGTTLGATSGVAEPASSSTSVSTTDGGVPAPAPAELQVTGVSCSGTSLASSSSTSCSVALSGTAGMGGATVALASNSAALTVPASITVPQGTASASFTVSTGAIAANSTGTLTASLNGSSASASISLIAAVTTVTVSSLTCPASSIGPWSGVTCLVTLSGTAPASGVTVGIAVSPANIGVLPPPPVSIFGINRAFVSIGSGAITSSQTVTITASLNGSSAQTTLSAVASTTTPAASTQLKVSAISCNSSSLTASSSTSCSVTLSGTAGTGGATVALVSNSAALKAPASFTVPQGAANASFAFTVSTGAIAANSTATLTASLDGSSASTSISLVTGSAVTVSSLTCPASSIGSWSGVTCLVTLSVAAPASGVSVGITVSPANIGVVQPPPVSISGINRAFVGIGSGTITASQTVTITASLNGSSAQTTLSAVASTTTKSASSSIAKSSALQSGNARGAFQNSAFSCDGNAIRGGDRTLCELRLDSPGAAADSVVSISSSSANLKTPGVLLLRAGQRQARFEIAAEAGATGEVAALSASVGASAVRTDVALSPMAAPSVTAPEQVSGNPASAVRFQVGSAAAADAAAPVILTVSRDGGRQAVAFREGAADPAALPNPDFHGQPAAAGDLLSVWVTGIGCDPNGSAPAPMLRFGDQYALTKSFAPQPNAAGVCLVTVEVPAGIPSGQTAVTLEVTGPQGNLSSNTASVAIEN